MRSQDSTAWPERCHVEAVARQICMTGAQETELHLISSSEVKANALEGKCWHG